jgi:hypothetical protein
MPTQDSGARSALDISGRDLTPADRPIGYAPRSPDLERGDTKAMIKLIEAMAKATVDHPDQVRVNGVEGENSLVIE